MGTYEAKVKKRMKEKADPKLVGGFYKDRPYKHIFKNLEDNFIDGKYPVCKSVKGNLQNSDILYHYANHMNSSQAMCISYFKKFFEKEEYEAYLAEILMITGIDVSGTEFTDAVFEYIADIAEKTNFDFYLKLKDGRSIFWEIKFTEKNFGTISGKGGTDYVKKWENVYIGKHKECDYYSYPLVYCDDYACLSKGTLTNDCQKCEECSIYEFYRYYQIRRNILYARQDDYVLFLTPRENDGLDEGRSYINSYAEKHNAKNIRNIYWEDLMKTTLDVVVADKELYDYYKAFKKKYFE